MLGSSVDNGAELGKPRGDSSWRAGTQMAGMEGSTGRGIPGVLQKGEMSTGPTNRRYRVSGKEKRDKGCLQTLQSCLLTDSTRHYMSVPMRSGKGWGCRCTGDWLIYGT